MLENGKYRGRPTSAALGLTKGGKEQIAVQFDLVDPAGESIAWYGYFTEGTMERTIQSLRYCGWTGTDLSVFTEGQPLPEEVCREVELVVEQEEYEGKVRAKVQWVNGGGGLALKNALTLDQAQAFARRMQGVITAMDRQGSQTRANPAPASTTPLEELEKQAESGSVPRGDVPF